MMEYRRGLGEGGVMRCGVSKTSASKPLAGHQKGPGSPVPEYLLDLPR
jgi:hypothetical protein